MISIILIEPEKSGNLGAVCRVMKNFGFAELVLVNPKCNPKSQEAKNRTKHAQDILRKVRVVSKMPKLDYIIGTTAKLGTDYNMARLPLTPKQLADKLVNLPKKTKIGLVFGREGDGLTNAEIMKCDLVVTIPSSMEYPTLNLSHSVAVVLYELFVASKAETNLDRINPAEEIDKKQILKMLDAILDTVQFSTKEKKDTQKIVWKRVINKAFLTKREAFVVMGLLRKMMSLEEESSNMKR